MDRNGRSFDLDRFLPHSRTCPLRSAVLEMRNLRQMRSRQCQFQGVGQSVSCDDEGGTDLAILSNPGGRPATEDVETRRKRVRVYNDYMAKLVQEPRQRSGILAWSRCLGCDGSRRHCPADLHGETLIV
jgi:hypothetical protein